MSFQGDVAGLGLGELLQSLCRGAQDGVLRLHGGSMSASVGVRGGLLYLLPCPDDDEDALRERCERAWADEPDATLEMRRREQIASTARLDTLYDLIGSSNVHFRFEPGPLTLPQNAAAWEGRGDAPFDEGINVEYMLLEHARLSDEAQDGGLAIHPYSVPCIVDITRAPAEVHAFLEHCVGRSTVREIADRLGCTLLQARVKLHKQVAAQTIRFATSSELLGTAMHEWVAGRRIRAASRLTGWICTSTPGPAAPDDAQLILTDWEQSNFKEVLSLLNPRVARALLRKLDIADTDRERSEARWELQRTAFRRDNIASLHLAAFRYLSGGPHETPALTDLLRLMRHFSENGSEERAQATLRLATSRLPSTAKGRTDLGVRMLEMGMMEGIDWLVNVARDHIDNKRAERAIGPAKEILRRLPGHRVAGELLQEAKLQGTRKRQRRTRSMIAAALTTLGAAVALVQFQSRRAYEARFNAVVAERHEPEFALELLDRDFELDSSERVQELRTELIDLKADIDENRASEWNAQFAEARELCSDGGLLAGLAAALDAGDPPDIPGRQFPARSELLTLLANRLEAREKESEPPLHATAEELAPEVELLELVDGTMALAAEHSQSDEVAAFHFRIGEIRTRMAERQTAREETERTLAAKALEDKQDQLWAAARAHASNGDYERSTEAYDQLFQQDQTNELRELLDAEYSKARDTLIALNEARERHSTGDTDGAIEILRERTETPSQHSLPTQVESRPSGARVEFSDGRVFSTPFTFESYVDQTLELVLSLPGYERTEVVLSEPRNVLVSMHRLPDREWTTGNRVEATPVPIAQDHLLADRHGILARLGQDGRERWRLELDALSGIARTPVFLPGRPTAVLVVSEDGKAWVIETSAGRLEGPLDLGATPVEGPTTTRIGVSLRLSDGRVAVWRDRLQPTVHPAQETYAEPAARESSESSSTLAVVRRSASSETRLKSPWKDILVEVEDEHFTVRSSSSAEPMFTVRRNGAWDYVAWESPNARIPEGRLWISDGSGLRAFLPIDSLPSDGITAK